MRDWTPSQAAARALVLLLPLVALLASLPAGAEVWSTFFLLVLLLSAGAAFLTDSVLGMVAMLLVLFWWSTRVPHPLSPWVLVAAAGLLGAHVAATVADHGPGTLDLDRGLVQLWVRRGGQVFLAAPLVWVVALLADGAAEEPGIWVAGLAAALVAVLFTTVAFHFPEKLE